MANNAMTPMQNAQADAKALRADCPGLVVTVDEHDEYGPQMQVDNGRPHTGAKDGLRIYYQGPHGVRFNAWANAFVDGWEAKEQCFPRGSR